MPQDDDYKRQNTDIEAAFFGILFIIGAILFCAVIAWTAYGIYKGYI